jgi:hypothetical protein
MASRSSSVLATALSVQDVRADRFGRPERRKGRDPVDGLRHAGGLVQLEAADPAGELRLSGKGAGTCIEHP